MGKNRMTRGLLKGSLHIELKAYALIFLFLLSAVSCITQFVPVIEEEKELLVVQGLITDQHATDTIKLSKSLPLGERSAARPVSGYSVSISDNSGYLVHLNEISPGTYITPSSFSGVIGHVYTLHITSNSTPDKFTYESYPVEMKPVPPIDSIYYEKTTIVPSDGFYKGVDGCQIYLDTHDPANSCRYYRWDYTETWVFRLLFRLIIRLAGLPINPDLSISKAPSHLTRIELAVYLSIILPMLPTGFKENIALM